MVCIAEEINTKSLDAIRPFTTYTAVGSLFRQEGTWDGNNEKTMRICIRDSIYD